MLSALRLRPFPSRSAPKAPPSRVSEIGRRLAAVALSAGLFVAAATAPERVEAQQSLFTTVVKVNDVIISGYDVDQRMRLVALGEPNLDRRRLQGRALEALVADQLKLQEAERQGLTISDAQVDDAVRQVADRNRQSEAEVLQVMAQNGVSEDAFRSQIRAEIAWNELIRRRFGNRVAPTDEDVDAAIAAAPQGGSVRYDVRQIVVPLAPDASNDLARRAFEEAARVRRELTTCERVRELAPRYARISGDVGRLTAEQMPPPVRQAVTPLEVGQATAPMRSPDGVHVIMLCGKATAAAESRSQVYNRLLQENAERFSESYLEDLRRLAMIEQPR